MPAQTHDATSCSPQAVPMVDFQRQYSALRAELLSAIERVCDSQRFVLGPAVESFEAAAAEACGVPHAVGCASGTDASWLAFAASGIGDAEGHADAVLTTPFSFFASASSILRAGARPIFADIDPFTFNLSTQACAEVLHKAKSGGSAAGICAIQPVHLFGQCAAWDAFAALAGKHNLLLIEDAAQAFGAAWRLEDGTLQAAGNLGHAAAFSFYPTKNLAAFGDAGLLTTCSSKVAERAQSLRTHGMRRRYFHDELGWNARLDAIQAAVLEVKLRYLGDWNDQRRAVAARYDRLLTAAGVGVHSSPAAPRTIADGVVLPYTHPQAVPVFHQYVVRAPRRDALRAFLAERAIASEVYYPLCLHQQPALASLGYRTGDFPESERAAGEVLALPIFPELRVDEQEAVVEAIRAFYA